MKCLYVGYAPSDGKSGGDIVRNNIRNALNSLKDIHIDEFLIEKNKSKLDFVGNILKFSFNGGKKQVVKRYKQKLFDHNYTHVFFDGSVFGSLVKYTKKKYPKIKTITQFHNLEIKYYIERVKVEGLYSTIVLPSVYLHEKWCSKYSDIIITFNQRDKEGIVKIYKCLANFYMIPIFFEDIFEISKTRQGTNYDYLFVGSAFYANIHGVKWFIDKVLPNVPGRLAVVGRGLEKLKEIYKDNEKLDILGTVEDIAAFYYQSNIVISPIFHGSGMKTKVIEALMYGKLIVGTSESFEGIPKGYNYICNTEDEFIKVLNEQITSNNSREIFINNFSIESARLKFEYIFKK